MSGKRTWIERVWYRTQAKRKVEARQARDVVLTAAKLAHACTVEHGGTMCGWPLDADGLCPEHE